MPSAPPTPLLPTSPNVVPLPPSHLPKAQYSPSSFPSEIPTPKSAGMKCLSLESVPESLKTPITPPSAYLDFLKTSIVQKTPTSATFKDIPPIPPTSAPLSAGCTCHTRRGLKKSSVIRRSTADSSSSRESSCDSTTSNGSACCTTFKYNYNYYPPPTPYTPFTPGSLKTPLSSGISGTKRLRIPPSPAFSPNYTSSSAIDSPFPIYGATPRTPITEEDEEELESQILSAGGHRKTTTSACRHKKIITVRADAVAMTKTARMKLMAAPKGKKRRVE